MCVLTLEEHVIGVCVCVWQEVSVCVCVCVEEGGFVLLQGSVPNLFQNIQSLFMCHTEKFMK